MINWSSKEIEKLVTAILLLETEEDAKTFLRDLMTEKEIREFSKRLQVAEMLSNKISYSVIEKETGLSSTTIARVAKWLNGKEGGYKNILDKLHRHSALQVGRRLS